MPAVKTGFTPPPMPGMPAPMQPMGGMPPAQNPFAPMPPMPLAGMPPPPMPPMAQGQMPQGQGQQMMGSTAGRRRRFGDALEGMLGRNQGIGAVPQRPLPMPPMMPQQRMVAPGTPMMRTPPMGRGMARPMADGGIVQYMQGGGAAKPSVKEFMDATGADFLEASRTLSTGSNIDIRDWDAIMSADDPLRASQAATAQMYSTGAPIATDERFYDAQGNYNPTAAGYGGTDVGASTGGPKLQVTGAGQIFITDSAGLPLTGLTPENAASFGITQDQIDAAIAAGGNAREGRFAGVGFVPGDYGNLLTDYSNVRGYTPSSSSSSSSSGGGGGSSSGGGSTVVSGDSGQGTGQMVGDIGSSAGSYEMASLYGPNLNIPEKVSQYVQDPVTGQITTTAGPVMTAISPIGAINLPARPAELDIFDYLGDPTYGSLLDKRVEGMRDGGPVVQNYQNAGEVTLDESGKQLNERGETAAEEALRRSQDRALTSDYMTNISSGLSDRSRSVLENAARMTGWMGKTARKALAGEDVNSQALTRIIKPNLKQLADATGMSLTEAGTILGTATFNQRDIRDWDAILSSDDPALAARLATRQAIEAGAYDRNAPAYRDRGFDESVYRDVQMPEGEGIGIAQVNRPTGRGRDNIQYHAMTPGGRRLTQFTGYNPDVAYEDQSESVQRGLARFGLDPVTQAAYEGSVSYLNPNMVPSIYYGIDWDDSYDPDPRNQVSQVSQVGNEGLASADIFSDSGLDSSLDNILNINIPRNYEDGGSVPRNTMIGNQPHMLAYINQDEEALLRSFGGSGISGPGGIPSYPPDSAVAGDYGAMGLSGYGGGHATDDDDSPSRSSTGPSGYTSLDAIAAAATANDDNSNRGSVNTSAKDADLGVGGSDKSVTASDLASGTGTTTYATDDGGSVTVATGSTIDNALSGGSSVMDVISPPSVSTPPAPTYTDRRGNTYSSQAAADAADRAFASQLASYSFDDDENYTPTADEMAAQLAAQGQTNVTQDPMSVNDQVAALMDRYDQFTPDQYDIESIFGDNYSAAEALANMEMAGLLSETELAQGTGGLRDASVDLSKGLGTKTGKVVSSQPITQEEKDRRNAIAQSILSKVEEQVEPTGIEAAFYDVISGLGLGLGKPFADALRDQSRENRQAIVDQHVNALARGATPVTDDDGNYIGFDISTMDTFADNVLSSDDIMSFMPPSYGTYSNPSYKEDADDDGIIDSERFDQVYSAQSTAAAEDPYGMSTEQGFITSDGKEFFVDAGGNVVEVTDGTVPFEVGGGKDVAAALGVTETTTGGDDGGGTTTGGTDTGHVDGVCNNPDYVYNPETDKCEPKAEETDDGDLGSPITTAITPRSFDEVLRSVVVPAPRIAPISENIRPMQAGGMVGLNRAADNFIKALAG